ncbi:hypothetical protein Ancab_040474 [Ancistrocladus abbreviatus]
MPSPSPKCYNQLSSSPHTMNTSKLPFHLLLLISTFFSPVFLSDTIAATELCNPIDKQALLDIKQSLGNPRILRTWDQNTDCCGGWFLVLCKSDTNRVWFLKVLYSHHVFGQISPAIGNLTHLEVLNFSKLPHLSGTLPHTLANLKKLYSLWVSYTNISGPIPEFLSQMTNLTDLFLTGNQFTGSVPPSLVQLTKLETLHLDKNKLTGAIPANYGSFARNILYLTLAGNQLTGPIPKSFANGNFSTLDLSRNKLTGDASFLFPNPNVFEIDINRNLLSFDLSKVKKFNSVLNHIDISFNNIYGNIPKSLTELTGLQYLNVTYNNLCGPIPTGGTLQNFNETSYFHNKCLCGAPLPACK